jgi:hypothetical protein
MCIITSLMHCLSLVHLLRYLYILDFKLSPYSEYCICSFGYFPGVRLCFSDVSEPSVMSMWNIPHPAFEDGPDKGFRNVGKKQSDGGEIPKRTYTIPLHISGIKSPSSRGKIYSCVSSLTVILEVPFTTYTHLTSWWRTVDVRNM